MDSAGEIIDRFTGGDPVAGTEALRELVALGDEGEEALFSQHIEFPTTVQLRRRWLRYIASRDAFRKTSIVERLFNRLQSPSESNTAAFLLAGLAKDSAITGRLFTEVKISMASIVDGYFSASHLFSAWGHAGGDAATLWNLIVEDSYAWERLVTSAFRAACASLSRVNTNDAWAIEQLVTHQWREHRLQEIGNSPDASIAHEAVRDYELWGEANGPFLMWRRGDVVDVILRDWSRHRHWRVRGFGAQVLASMGFTRTVAPVLEWLGREPEAAVRQFLLHVLERTEREAGADALLEYFRASGEEGRPYVARSAWRASDKNAALDALQTIANGNDTPASEALVSLARIGQRHARLEAMLDSPDQYYRLNAALAAAYLGDKARTWHLTEMLNEASAPIERVYLQSALAIMGRPNGAAELHRELIAMASEPDFNKRLDIFFMHRYLQMAVLDGLQAGGESAAGLWHVWHDELQPLDPVPKPVEVTTKAKAASVAVPAVPGTVGENAEPTEPLNDDDAEHLMTVDKIARANGTNSVPPPLPPPPSRKTRKGFLVGVVVLALFILLGIYLAPYIHTLLANQLSPVVVPNSHFVGQHGRNKKLLVFVHGVMGDMDNTWVNAETHASWPELITGDPDLTDFDVFVYGYASPAMGDASTIGQISVRFLQQLKDFRFFNNYNEVSFVTHSMGGIVTKRTLDMLNTQADNSILQKVHTVIYISVPSNGANLAALASWLSENPQFKGMSPKNAADFLQSVEGDWANLLRQRTPSSPFPRTYSAYETLPTGPVEVVPELYTSGLSDLPVIGFDYNHINIVKPKDREAELYRWVKARLLEEVSVLPAK